MPTINEIWTSDEAVDGYIRLSGNVQTGLIEGVRCCDALDVENYDNENYRDTFFNTFSTGQNPVVNFDNGGIAVAAKAIVDTTEDGDVTTANIPTTNSGLIDQNGITVTDEAMHIPPRNEKKLRTLLRFWSGPFTAGTGTGNVLASVWSDEFVAFAPNPYSFI